MVLAGIFAVVGMAWLLRSSVPATTPLKAAEGFGSAPVNVETAALSKVEAPGLAPPVAPRATKAGAATAPRVAADDTDKQATAAELSAVVDDMVDLVQAGDVVAFFDKYTPPEELAQMTPEAKAQMVQNAQQWMTDSATEPFARALLLGWQSLQNQAPVLNAARDEASYQMKLPAIIDPSRGLDIPAMTRPMVFEKIDGHWYVKGNN